MHGVTGWSRSDSGDLGLRAYVVGQAGTVVTLEANGLWSPSTGDVITDGVLSDVIVQVTSPTSVKTRTATGFGAGFVDVTLKQKKDRLRSVANFIGNVIVSDNANRRELQAVLGAGSIIEGTLTGSDSQFSPPGWSTASIVLISPEDDGPPCLEGAHWASWQGVKLLVNTGLMNFDVVDSSGLLSEDDIVIAGSPLTVQPGEAIMLIRHPVEDRWRGVFSSGDPFVSEGLVGNGIDVVANGAPVVT